MMIRVLPKIDLSKECLSHHLNLCISTSWNEHLVWKGRINCVIIIPRGADFVNRSPALPRCDSLCRNMHCRSCNHFTHSTGECKCTGSSFFNATAFGYAKEFHVAIFSMIFKVIVLVSISALCKCSFRRFSVGSFISTQLFKNIYFMAFRRGYKGFLTVKYIFFKIVLFFYIAWFSIFLWFWRRFRGDFGLFYSFGGGLDGWFPVLCDFCIFSYCFSCTMNFHFMI